MPKVEKEAPARTVDDYLRAVPGKFRPMLEELRAAILTAAPMAEELISYRIPTYKYKGPLVHFAAFADHCSFITVTREALKEFGDELKSFTISGTTIHITPERPIPAALVKKIVKSRIKENEATKKGTKA